MRSPLSPYPWLALFITAGLAGCGPVSLPTAEPDQGAPAAAPEVVDYNLITACGTVLTQPGKYRLEKDLSCANVAFPPTFESALVIAGSHMVVDLNGRRISNNGGAVYNGITVRGATDVTIRGPGFVEGFLELGILVESSSGVRITKLIERANVDYGLIVRSSSDVTIHDNVFHGTETQACCDHRQADIQAAGSSLHLLYNRTGIASGEGSSYGILVGGSGIEVRGNHVEGALWGLSLGGDGGLVTANDIHGAAVALLVGGHGNKILANKLSNDGLLLPPDVFAGDIMDSSGCGANFYKGNWFTTASPACVQVPRVEP